MNYELYRAFTYTIDHLADLNFDRLEGLYIKVQTEIITRNKAETKGGEIHDRPDNGRNNGSDAVDERNNRRVHNDTQEKEAHERGGGSDCDPEDNRSGHRDGIVPRGISEPERRAHDLPPDRNCDPTAEARLGEQIVAAITEVGIVLDKRLDNMLLALHDIVEYMKPQSDKGKFFCSICGAPGNRIGDTMALCIQGHAFDIERLKD